MKHNIKILTLLILAMSCKSTNKVSEETDTPQAGTSVSLNSKVIVTFGSCNKHNLENVFWDDVLALNPDIFIWGGDNVYADTEDIDKLRGMYDSQDSLPAYAKLKEEVFITGTWDDHDYGLNDGGVEFGFKKESQQAFLDFMEVSKNDRRRSREGVYSSQLVSKPSGLVKIINLDTRYFRTSLKDSETKGRRYDANPYGQGTVLGVEQWKWLQTELKNSTAKFNIIVSSIQFLSNEHGFEKWANFPHEVDKMKQVLKETQAKNVIFLSGDRHISEFSKTNIDGLNYPVIDFTSSGLTHAYSNFSGEPNPFRAGEVVSTTSFGMLEIDLEGKEVTFKMMGDNGEVLQQLKQSY